jgi:hypothetical protein
VDVIDEIKVRAVIALSDDLHNLDLDDTRYPVVLDRLDHAWRALSSAEQDEVDRILGQRGSSKRLHIIQVISGAEGE